MENKENNMENKENKMKKNRLRGDNWTQEEKDLFIEIMGQSASIIENKLTDTNSNKRKNLEWLKVQNRLKELTGKPRDVQQLKGFWRRTKVAAKKSVYQHRRAIHATGGGQKPPSPSPDDAKIMDLCPTDFVVEENLYDSDAVLVQVTGQDNTARDVDDEANNSTIYDIEENDDVDDEAEVSFVHEVITVGDERNNEIDIKPCGTKKETKPKLEKGSTAQRMNKNSQRKKYQRDDTSKAALIGTSIQIKKRALELFEEEYLSKIEYQHKELEHQQSRHKLETEALMLEIEKKKLEVEVLKKTLQ